MVPGPAETSQVQENERMSRREIVGTTRKAKYQDPSMKHGSFRTIFRRMCLRSRAFGQISNGYETVAWLYTSELKHGHTI